MEKKEKAMLIIDMPKNCAFCKLFWKGYCAVESPFRKLDILSFEYTHEKDKNCPLQPYDTLACGEVGEVLNDLEVIGVQSTRKNLDENVNTMEEFKNAKSHTQAQAKEISELKKKMLEYINFPNKVDFRYGKDLPPVKTKEYEQLENELKQLCNEEVR